MVTENIPESQPRSLRTVTIRPSSLSVNTFGVIRASGAGLLRSTRSTSFNDPSCEAGKEVR
jgi:hypothetical protein